MISFQLHNAPPAPRDPRPLGVPFDTAEEAWFWFMAARAAMMDGARPRAGLARVVRPCESADILNAVDRLYRGRLITREHLFVLRYYGARFEAPDPDSPREMRAARLWHAAMNRLAYSLRRRGIVVDPSDDFLLPPSVHPPRDKRAS